MFKEYFSYEGHPLILGLPVDICIFTVTSTQKSGDDHTDGRKLRGLPKRTLELLLVKRHGEPHAGKWALPGGFTHIQHESLLEAACRELKEETNVDAHSVPNGAFEQLSAYYSPHRDPRGYTPTVAFVALINESHLASMKSGGDASDAKLFRVEQEDGKTTQLISRDGDVLTLEDLAFDHGTIVQDGLAFVRAKMMQTAVASSLLPETFTLAELHTVIKAVIPEYDVPSSNFARDVRGAKFRHGLLEEVKGPDDKPMTTRKFSSKPAQLYRFSDRQVPVSIYPGYAPRA